MEFRWNTPPRVMLCDTAGSAPKRGRASRIYPIFAADVILQVRAGGANPQIDRADLDPFRKGRVVLGTCDPLWAPQAAQQIDGKRAILDLVAALKE